MQIKNHSFKHTRSEAILEERPHLSATQEFDGELMAIAAPFGVDIYIQLFDGENRYLVSGTGGHSSNFLFVEMQVDSMQKVVWQSNSRDAESREKFYEDLHRHLSYGLPKEVYELIKGYFAAS